MKPNVMNKFGIFLYNAHRVKTDNTNVVNSSEVQLDMRAAFVF